MQIKVTELRRRIAAARIVLKGVAKTDRLALQGIQFRPEGMFVVNREQTLLWREETGFETPVLVDIAEISCRLKGWKGVIRVTQYEHGIRLISDVHNVACPTVRIDAAELPTPERRVEDSVALRIANGPEWIDCASSAARSSDDDATRFQIHSVLVERSGLIVATDGKRLSKISGPAPTSEDRGGYVESAIVPLPFVKLAAKVRPVSSSVWIDLGYTVIETEDGSIRMTTRNVEGRFPDWRRAMPKNQSAWIRPDETAMRAAIELHASAIAKDKDRSVTKMELEGGELRLETATKGDPVVSRVPCSGELAEPIRLNPRYVSDIYKGKAGWELGTIDRSTAVLFRDNIAAEVVVMPIVVQE